MFDPLLDGFLFVSLCLSLYHHFSLSFFSKKKLSSVSRTQMALYLYN